MNANPPENGLLNAGFGGEAGRIGQLAGAGEAMVERLRRTAFLPGAA